MSDGTGVYEIVDGIPSVDGREVRFAIAVYVNDYAYPPHIHLPPTHERGFQVPLENSLIVSTMFGSHNYCSNREPWIDRDQWQWSEQATTAELGCWWAEGEQTRVRTADLSMVDTIDVDSYEYEIHLLDWPDGDLVTGWFPATRWWALIEALSQVPKGGIISDRADILALISQDVDV